ncbi:rod shape-determining protein MreC [Deltaproteobacteria bacterium TL4]
MLDFIKKYRLFLSIFFTIIVTLIFLFQTGRQEDGTKLQVFTQTITYPIQALVHQVLSSTTNVANSYFYLVQLHEENENLKKQLASLQEEVDQYIEESIQYHRLQIQLEFAVQNPDKKIFAEVIGESIDNFHKTLFINRGSHHGIQRNFAVILKEGVVGRIQSVTPFQSTVQLILDHRSRFPAIIQRTRKKGIIYGTQNGIELRQLHLRSDIKVGDRVVTNGLSGLFPKGLLIGIVSEIHHEEYELFQTAYLTPIVDFNKIEGVFVILKTSKTPGNSLFSKR